MERTYIRSVKIRCCLEVFKTALTVSPAHASSTSRQPRLVRQGSCKETRSNLAGIIDLTSVNGRASVAKFSSYVCNDLSNKYSRKSPTVSGMSWAAWLTVA